MTKALRTWKPRRCGARDDGSSRKEFERVSENLWGYNKPDRGMSDSDYIIGAGAASRTVSFDISAMHTCLLEELPEPASPASC